VDEATRIPTTYARPIVVYDGACGLCSRWVAFVLAHERTPEFDFAPFDSEVGAHALERAGETDSRSTVLVVDGDRVLRRSDAVLRIARSLKRPWRWVTWSAVIPRAVRDAVYRLIARHRHRIAPPNQACDLRMMDRHRGRFVEARPRAPVAAD